MSQIQRTVHGIAATAVVVIGGLGCGGETAPGEETVASGLAVTVSFQDGVVPTAAYAGSRDTTLVEKFPAQAYGQDLQARSDADDPGGSGLRVVGLLQWDVSAVPLDATVQSASVTLDIVNPSSGTFSLYALQRAWAEASATWAQAATGNPWQVPGAADATDRAAVVLGSFKATAAGSVTVTLNANGIAQMQAWVQEPASNRGLLVASPHTDGLAWSARETANAAKRPLLTVSYLPTEGGQPPAQGATLVAKGASWKYLDTGVDPGSAWRTAGFDDGAWKSGLAELGYGDGDEATVVGFSGNTSARYVTTWFRRSFQVSDAAAWQGLKLGLERDDGAAVYLNGIEVMRSNLPAGALLPTTLASIGVEGASFHELAIDPKLLLTGANQLAVEVHQAAPSSSDISFDLALVGSAGAPPAIQALIAKKALWKYLDTGSEPQATWRTAGYDDAAWPSGAGELGYGDGDEATVLGYGPSMSARYITTWFRRVVDVTDPKAITALALAVKRDDGAIVYVNGTEVWRNNLPAGPIGAATLASTAIDDDLYHGASVDPALLVAGANAIAVELHQAGASSSDISFDLELNATMSAAQPPVCTDCDDGNACTTDGCDSQGACSHVANSTPCNDGNACTTGDACANKACSGSAVDCQDGNVCTSDSCDPATGCSHAIACGTQLQSTFGGAGIDQAFAVQATADGGAILAGSTASTGAGATDALLLKVDGCGATQWARTFGGAGNDSAAAVLGTADGGYVMVGGSASWDPGGDIYVVKTDANGNKQWSLTHGGGGDDLGQSVSQTADGGYVIAAKTFSFGPNTPALHNGLVLKLDGAGKVLWSRVLAAPAGTGSMDTVGVREVKNPSTGAWDGLMVIGGSEGVSYGSDDVWWTRLAADGSVVWAMAYGGPADDDPVGFVQVADGGFVAAGSTKGWGAISSDGLMLKIDWNGKLLWWKRYGGAGQDLPTGLAASADGGFVVTGMTTSYGAVAKDGFAMKVDAAGGLQWLKAYGGALEDQAMAVAATADGGLWLAGYAASSGAGGYDVWLVRAGSDGLSGCQQLSPSSISQGSATPGQNVFSPVELVAGTPGLDATVQGIAGLTAAAICPCK